MFGYWLTCQKVYNYVRGGKDALILKTLLDTLGCVVFHYYIYKKPKKILKTFQKVVDLFLIIWYTLIVLKKRPLKKEN